MPSFDIVSEIDKQEIDNALNQARKELATRFDFKGSVAGIEYDKDTEALLSDVKKADALSGGRSDTFLKQSVARGVEAAGEDECADDESAPHPVIFWPPLRLGPGPDQCCGGS